MKALARYITKTGTLKLSPLLSYITLSGLFGAMSLFYLCEDSSLLHVTLALFLILCY